MEPVDFRSLGRDTQEALRARAVYLVQHGGRSQGEAAEAVGARRQIVNLWLRRYAEGGDAALRSLPSGLTRGMADASPRVRARGG